MSGELEIIIIVLLVNVSLALCCIAIYVHFLMRKKKQHAYQSNINSNIEGMWRGGDGIHLFKIEQCEGFYMWKHCDDAGDDVRGQLEKSDDQFGERFVYYCELSNGIKVYLCDPCEENQVMSLKLVLSDKSVVDVDARRWATELESSIITDTSSQLQEQPLNPPPPPAIQPHQQSSKERSFAGVSDGWQLSHA